VQWKINFKKQIKNIRDASVTHKKQNKQFNNYEMKNLAKAVLAVMNEVKGIDKSMNVGTGQMSYKGVPDQEVKKIVGQAMQKNGLVLIPTSIDPKTQINEWDETTQYGVKRKQSVFTEVITKYILIHESGESIEVCGYGHGVDSQDKGAGKATTYALKYAMLYTFLIPTGKIDDSDSIHSEEIPVKQKAQTPINNKGKIDNDRFANAIKEIESGNYTAAAMRATFDLTVNQEGKLNEVEQVKQNKDAK
jgi:hypothetical protein